MKGRHVPRMRASVAVLVALVLTAAACGGGSSSNKKQVKAAGVLNFASPGGTYARAQFAAYLKPFESTTGIKINEVETTGDLVAQTRIQATSRNVLWDVTMCGPTLAAANPDIYEKIDYSKIPAAAGLASGLRGEKYLAQDIEAYIFAYNSDTFKSGGPKSWADFFDVQKFPGPRGVPNVGLESAYTMPIGALLADGVSLASLFPLDLDRAYRKLNQLKPHIRVFWTSFTQSQDILRSGEVVANVMTDGRANQLVFTGNPVVPVFDGGVQFTSSYCVTKGSPHKEEAYKLFQYVLSHPDQQAIFSSLTFYGPPTPAGAAAAQTLGVKDMSTFHLNQLVQDSPQFTSYVQQHSDDLLNRWNKWVGL